jgi:hypothetical protein
VCFFRFYPSVVIVILRGLLGPSHSPTEIIRSYTEKGQPTLTHTHTIISSLLVPRYHHQPTNHPSSTTTTTTINHPFLSPPLRPSLPPPCDSIHRIIGTTSSSQPTNQQPPPPPRSFSNSPFSVGLPLRKSELVEWSSRQLWQGTFEGTILLPQLPSHPVFSSSSILESGFLLSGLDRIKVWVRASSPNLDCRLFNSLFYFFCFSFAV